MKRRMRKSLERDIIVYSKGIEDFIRSRYPDKREVSPEVLNLVRVGLAVREHAFIGYRISRSKLLEFVGLMWDRGKGGRRVYDFKEEGQVLDAYMLGYDIAALLTMWGQEKGYLEKKRKTRQNDK